MYGLSTEIDFASGRENIRQELHFIAIQYNEHQHIDRLGPRQTCNKTLIIYIQTVDGNLSGSGPQKVRLPLAFYGLISVDNTHVHVTKIIGYVCLEFFAPFENLSVIMRRHH